MIKMNEKANFLTNCFQREKKTRMNFLFSLAEINLTKLINFFKKLAIN